MSRRPLLDSGAKFREAVASAMSQAASSAVTFLIVAGMVLTVMLTTGRTVGAEEQILDSIGSASSRSIVVHAEPDAGLTAKVLERVAALNDVEWSAGFSAAVDVTNSAISQGVRVPARQVYSADPGRLGIPAATAADGTAWASRKALRLLGLPDTVGSITTTAGVAYGVGGRIKVPDFLRQFEPVVLIPTARTRGDEAVTTLLIVARSPELVAPLRRVLQSILGVDDPTKVSVRTSEDLLKLRKLIGVQLGAFSRGLVLAMLTLMGALVAALLFGLVMMRRRDFGRRRALGASRSLIIQLLMFQTAVVALTGILVGICTSWVVLRIGGDALPGFRFTSNLAIVVLATCLTATSVPALLASRREPIRELRVP